MIGTGSSGIQAIPVLAAQAAHLTVFQRTAHYSVPARNRPLAQHEIAEVKATYPETAGRVPDDSGRDSTRLGRARGR